MLRMNVSTLDIVSPWQCWLPASPSNGPVHCAFNAVIRACETASPRSLGTTTQLYRSSAAFQPPFMAEITGTRRALSRTVR